LANAHRLRANAHRLLVNAHRLLANARLPRSTIKTPLKPVVFSHSARLRDAGSSIHTSVHSMQQPRDR
jgi:hypothetical protein